MWRMATKNNFRTKNSTLGLKKRPFWAIGAMKQPAERPNDHLPENQRYSELPQDMGDL